MSAEKLRAALLVAQRRPSFFVSLNLSNLQRWERYE